MTIEDVLRAWEHEQGDRYVYWGAIPESVLAETVDSTTLSRDAKEILSQIEWLDLKPSTRKDATMPADTTDQHDAIRAYCGHNGHECKVRITDDGEVHRYGSPDPVDRSQDHWTYLGTVDELLHEIYPS